MLPMFNIDLDEHKHLFGHIHEKLMSHFTDVMNEDLMSNYVVSPEHFGTMIGMLAETMLEAMIAGVEEYGKGETPSSVKSYVVNCAVLALVDSSLARYEEKRDESIDS